MYSREQTFHFVKKLPRKGGKMSFFPPCTPYYGHAVMVCAHSTQKNTNENKSKIVMGCSTPRKNCYAYLDLQQPIHHCPRDNYCKQDVTGAAQMLVKLY